MLCYDKNRILSLKRKNLIKRFSIDHLHIFTLHHNSKRISGVMMRMVASGAVDRGFEPRSSQLIDYKIAISFFSAKNAIVGSKRNARNRSDFYI